MCKLCKQKRLHQLKRKINDRILKQKQTETLQKSHENPNVHAGEMAKEIFFIRNL